MATRLTTPIDRPDITHQGILRVTFEIPHKLNVDETNIIIDKDGVKVQYLVVSLNALREEISRHLEIVSWANWTAGFKADAASVLNKLEVDAKNKGLILPGTDEPLE